MGSFKLAKLILSLIFVSSALFPRYYDAAIGRWVSKDKNTGITKQPVTLNRYIYAVNNPLAFVDPDGNAVIGSFLLGDSKRIYIAQLRTVSDYKSYILTGAPTIAGFANKWIGGFHEDISLLAIQQIQKVTRPGVETYTFAENPFSPEEINQFLSTAGKIGGPAEKVAEKIKSMGRASKGIKLANNVLAAGDALNSTANFLMESLFNSYLNEAGIPLISYDAQLLGEKFGRYSSMWLSGKSPQDAAKDYAKWGAKNEPEIQSFFKNSQKNVDNSIQVRGDN